MQAAFIVVTIFGVSIICFYVLFHQVLFLKLGRLKNKAEADCKLNLAEAKEKGHQLLETATRDADKKKKALLSDFHSGTKIAKRDFLELEGLLDGREINSCNYEEKILKKEKIVAELEEASNELEKSLNLKIEKMQATKDRVLKELELVSNTSMTDAKNDVMESLIEKENLRANYWMKTYLEEVKENSQKIASSVLYTVMSRFQPKFMPTPVKTIVDFPSEKIKAKFFADDSRLLKAFEDQAKVTITSLDDDSLSIKITDGFGIDKERTRLALEEMILKGDFSISSAGRLLRKHGDKINRDLKILGDKNFKAMRVTGLHPELKKLITALNYRSSFTQNQFYHSLEVGELFGLLASELNLDVKIAKRMGLLHDLGKALDYRIEGSHAIISADYAEKFGESQLVSDTVRSHHNDIILETPFADLLKASDALSSARPGARIDLEEGYIKRIDSIRSVLANYSQVVSSSIMQAGREIRVYVDNRKVNDSKLAELGEKIARQLEAEVKFPGQIRLTVVRKLELVSTV